MKKRWVAAGMLEAERSFRRVEVQGHAQARRRPPSRGHARRCHTRRVRSGSSLNTLWPPLNFNNERGNVFNRGSPG